MSTDTNGNGSLATAEAQRIAEKLAQIKTWAAEREIPIEAVAAAFGGDEPRSIEQPLPPNHTCVTWFDIHRPDGGKLHVVVRGGATRGSVLDVVFTASNAFGDLVDQGWMPADRRPRTEAEIEETTAKLEEKLTTGAKRKAAKRTSTPDDDQEAPSTRTIEVESILKRVTDTGNVNYLVKGHPWKKYGVTAWPDSGQVYKLDAVVDLEKWGIGEVIDFKDNDIQAVVQLKEGGKPGKVIDFVGADALDDDPSV